MNLDSIRESLEKGGKHFIEMFFQKIGTLLMQNQNPAQSSHSCGREARSELKRNGVDEVGYRKRLRRLENEFVKGRVCSLRFLLDVRDLVGETRQNAADYLFFF